MRSWRTSCGIAAASLWSASSIVRAAISSGRSEFRDAPPGGCLETVREQRARIDKRLGAGDDVGDKVARARADAETVAVETRCRVHAGLSCGFPDSRTS